jgi:hypothetical protein
MRVWNPIDFQGQRVKFLLHNKYVPSVVKIHWRMLILECSQGYYTVKYLPSDLDLWPRKSIGFQTLLRTKYVPSLVKIHWRMLILECSQGCYAVKIWSDFQGQRSISPGQIFTVQHPCEHSRINILQWILTKLDTYIVLMIIWNPIDFQGQRVKFLLHNILVNTLESRSHWPLTLKINRVPDSPKD